MIKAEVFADFQVPIAPCEFNIRRRLQRVSRRGNLKEPAVRRILQLLVIEHHGKRPATRLLRCIRVYDVKHALWLGIIHVTLQLPALHHRAAVRYFHSVEFVFDDDGALLRIAFCRDVDRRRRRHCCRRGIGLRSIRRG